jgi:heavy metal translocating P-type ATPase
LVASAESCDLCGLKIDGAPVVRTFDHEEKHFCCQGCARVYEVALDRNMLDRVLPQPSAKPPGFPGVILGKSETAYFSVDGMWCAGCAVAAEQVLQHQPGIKGANVSFAAERGRIQYDPTIADPAAILQDLDSLGYRARLLGDPGEALEEKQQERTLRQLIVAVAFGMQVMILYLVQLYPLYATHQFDAPDVRRIAYLAWALATPAFLWGGSSFLRGAWRAWRARTATMDTLVALGTLSAYGYSAYMTLTGLGEAYFDSVTMITAFVMIGRYLETLGGAQARKDIRGLLRLQPDNARKRQDDGTWQETQFGALAVSDVILIRPGERIPADAIVLEGEGAVDESLLTGESVPVDKVIGDPIYAGTVVTDAMLIGQVTRLAAETRLAQITRLIEETLASKPPIQRLADRASAYFAWGILAVALLTTLVWIWTGHSPAEALLSAVAVLVVACPCALGLATPLALTVTLGRTTRAGILVRNPTALETAAQVQRVVFDKTGTLTLGRMAVVDTVANSQASYEQVAAPPDGPTLLCLAAAVEQYSEHPIARAIVGACTPPLPEAHEFKALRGQGASAQVEGQRIMVGSAQFLDVNAETPLAVAAQDHVERGETVVWVGGDGRADGFIALRDKPNPTARDALDHLERSQVRAVMLSGDDPRTTRAVASELGLAEYEGHCPPTAKARHIQEWQEAGEKVAMVGDGVNDAPALAKADLSITNAGGADVAGETSDVVLTRADLTLIPWFIGQSRRTRRTILQNLGWAFAYNLVSVPLAASGSISPAIAAVAMAASSLLVVGNSLRLRNEVRALEPRLGQVEMAKG